MKVLFRCITVMVVASAPVLPTVWAQDTLRPAFEVATIKPTDPNLPVKHDTGLFFYPGSLTAKGQTLRDLIKFAYAIKSEDQLAGGPSWTDSERYDIEARTAPALVPDLQALPLNRRTEQLRMMLRSLLIDRFHLKTETALRELPVFALTVTKNGPKLLRSAPAAEGQPPLPEIVKGGGGRIVAVNTTLRSLATTLSGQPEMRNRMVLDHTELPGAYSFTLTWTPESDSSSSGAAPVNDTPAPSLFTALQEQLGLKLEPAKGPVETLIILSAEKPTAN